MGWGEHGNAGARSFMDVRVCHKESSTAEHDGEPIVDRTLMLHTYVAHLRCALMLHTYVVHLLRMLHTNAARFVLASVFSAACFPCGDGSCPRKIATA